MARAGRDACSTACGIAADLVGSAGRSELTRLLVVTADHSGSHGASADVPLVVGAAVRVAWATPEQPATVRLELKVKPKMQFLHG